MNPVSEWLAAIGCVIVGVAVLIAAATIVSGGAIILLAVMVIGAGLDIILLPIRWLSSSFHSTKENGKREEDDR